MQHPPSFDDGRPRFDPQFASELLGKTVLVGVTIFDKRGNELGQEQFFGKIKTADAVSGIAIELQGARAGETKKLPPATHVYEKALPGTYKLRSTGESVVNPDYTSTWSLTRPDA